MDERKAKRNEPVFVRQVYDENMRRVRKAIPQCECPLGPVPKSRAKVTTCAACGGAILTAQEKLYVKSLRR
jgi:hypothetical protein